MTTRPYGPRPAPEAGPAVFARPRRRRSATRSWTAWGLVLLAAAVGLGGGGGCAARSARDAAPPPDDCRPAPENAFETLRSTPARPPFFRVTAANGSTLHLLGTIHLGPPEGWRLPAPVRSALAASETVVLEIELATATEDVVSELLLRTAMLPDDEQLADRVSPETLRLLEARSDVLADQGFPPDTQRRMEPWFLALMLSEAQIRRTPFVVATSVDARIDALRGDRPVIALETVQEQLALFDTLPADLQEVMLRDALATLDEAPEDLTALAWSWHRGDETNLACLARTHVDERPDLDAFYEVVLDERNADWQRALQPLLARPDARLFAAVGALHLVGSGSLPGLLEQAGYRVERIELGEGP